LRKIIVLLVIEFLMIFVMTGCDSIIPGEGEGEGEGEPEPDKMTVLVEAYVAVGCSHCAQVEPILENLAMEYSRDEMILVELVPWGSTYNIREAYQRYNWYGLTGGVPQILFNGLNNNIQGATTYSVIKNIIEAQLATTPTIKLEASRTASSNGTVISGTVQNISSETLTNLVINEMTIKDMGTTGFHYCVTDIFEEDKVVISSLAPGEEESFTMTIEGLNWTAQTDGFVLSPAHPKKLIRQSVFLN